MREQLKNIDWHVYGLSVDNIDYVINLTERAILDRESALTIEAGSIRCENPDNADDILDDISYYNYIECT